MSQWGVYFDADGYCHVAPYLADGRFPVRHSLHEFCPCGPLQREVYGRIIYVHQDESDSRIEQRSAQPPATTTCKHEHGSGLMYTNGHGEFTCHDCGDVLVLGRGLSRNSSRD